MDLAQSERQQLLPSRRTGTLSIDSVLAYVFGYLVAYGVYLLGLFVFGLLAGRDPTVFHNTVVYQSPGDAWTWGGGVVFVLLFGLAMWSIFQDAGESTAPARLVVLWLLLHAFSRGLVQLIALPFAEDSDAAQALGFFDVPDGVQWIVGLAALIAFLWMGVLTARPLLSMATDRGRIDDPLDRATWIGWLGVVPWVVGGLLIVPFYAGATGSNAGVSGIPLAGAFLIATLLAGWRDENTEPDNPNVYLAWWLVLILAGLWALFQFVLADGLSFT